MWVFLCVCGKPNWKMSSSLKLPQTIPEPLRAHILPFTPEVALLASANPQSPTMTPPPSSAPTASSLQNAIIATTLLPWEEVHMQVHTILIVVIFCVVCLLLLLAFFYAFCFHCSIKSSPKDSDNRCSMDREDATYKRSSSDNQSVGNVVWHWPRMSDVWHVYECIYVRIVLFWWHVQMCCSRRWLLIPLHWFNSLKWYWFAPDWFAAFTRA